MAESNDPSALVVLVPEAESVVKPFRDRYDPSAATGMPAHVTLLYPFKRSNEVDEKVLHELRHCFTRFAPIGFSLSSVRRFPEVLYLAPEPDEPFRQLTLAIWDCYPEVPPMEASGLRSFPTYPSPGLRTNSGSTKSLAILSKHRESNCRSGRLRRMWRSWILTLDVGRSAQGSSLGMEDDPLAL